MRLLTTDGSFPVLEEFAGPADAPPYAILSHRWEGSEISYEDLLDSHARTNVEPPKVKSWHKIQNARRVALEMDFSHIWIDTCCIDKASSAELSEAINSMYFWYEQSGICIAYLSDVEKNMGSSRYFRRGWTLQEVIAPQNLAFYSRTWQFRGFRADLASRLTQWTKIPVSILMKPSRTALRSQSAARRLSWAAFRTTTRPEDRTYCLFGLFDLSMPIIYGEGASKAFWRFQAEIFRTTADHSIFAWRFHPKFVYPPTANLFASDPSCFWKSSNVVACPYASVVPAKELQHMNRIYLNSDYSSFSHGLKIQFLVSYESLNDTSDSNQSRAVKEWHGVCLLACSDLQHSGRLFAINITSPQPGQILRRSLQDPRLYGASDISSCYQTDFFIAPSSFADDPLNRLPRPARLLTPRSNLRVIVYDSSALASSFSRSITGPSHTAESSAHWQADQSVENLSDLHAEYKEASRGLSFSIHFNIQTNKTMSNPGYEDAQLKFLLEIGFDSSANNSSKESSRSSSIKTEAVGILKKTTVIELRSETHFRPDFILWPTYYYTYDSEDETGVLNVYLRVVTTNRARSFPSQQSRPTQPSGPSRARESASLFTRRLTYDHK